MTTHDIVYVNFVMYFRRY